MRKVSNRRMTGQTPRLNTGEVFSLHYSDARVDSGAALPERNTPCIGTKIYTGPARHAVYKHGERLVN